MTSIAIDRGSLPNLANKTALITGGSSGIGLATAQLLTTLQAKVHIVDLKPPADETGWRKVENLRYHKCDITRWPTLRAVFQTIGRADLIFANAGIADFDQLFTQDIYDDRGLLKQPDYSMIDVNLRAVLDIIKLSRIMMRKHGTGGAIVLTSSASAYSPEISLPVYSAIKSAHIGLVRGFRPILIREGITINAVAPCMTETDFLPSLVSDVLNDAGVPPSSPEDIALALVFSATAKQTRRAVAYGKDRDGDNDPGGRWNGRVIFVNGNRYTEVEEPLASLRPQWLGPEQDDLLKRQQVVTDTR